MSSAALAFSGSIPSVFVESQIIQSGAAGGLSSKLAGRSLW
jgi:hypothetical protein